MTTEEPRVLIAGIGNIFLGDDAFGSEVARRLAGHPWPAGVRVVDFGIRGLDLGYALCDDYELTVLIDATAQGSEPGTLHVIELDLSAVKNGPPAAPAMDAHTLDPMKVLALAYSLGAKLNGLILVGCEPAELGGEEGQLGMSDPVSAAVEQAVELVPQLVRNFLNHSTIAASDSPVSAQRDQATALSAGLTSPKTGTETNNDVGKW